MILASEDKLRTAELCRTYLQECTKSNRNVQSRLYAAKFTPRMLTTIVWHTANTDTTFTSATSSAPSLCTRVQRITVQATEPLLAIRSFRSPSATAIFQPFYYFCCVSARLYRVWPTRRNSIRLYGKRWHRNIYRFANYTRKNVLSNIYIYRGHPVIIMLYVDHC